MRKLSMHELERVTPDEFRRLEKLPVVLVLDNVRSALNVGSAFRTGDAFAVEKIFLCGITATPPHREILKTALGATEAVAWEYLPSATVAVSLLKAKGYKVLAVEQATGSGSLKDFQPKAGIRYALIFGNEVQGVSEETLVLADGCVEIPQVGTKHSLNVAVAVGIVVWDFFSKMQM